VDEEDLAELWGVDVDDVLDLAAQLGLHDIADFDWMSEVAEADGSANRDSMLEMADYLDVDVHDLYNLYYGYED